MSSKNKAPLAQLTRNQIANATFTAAEKMGISDRRHIERLTRQVIERLEAKQEEAERTTRGKAQPLPDESTIIAG